jgi:hypothetical protein
MICFNHYIFVANDGSIEVEHWTHHPKVKGSSPTAILGTKKQKMTKIIFSHICEASLNVTRGKCYKPSRAKDRAVTE